MSRKKMRELAQSYGEYRSDPDPEPEYSGCLSAFLGFQILGGLAGLGLLFILLSQPTTPMSRASSAQGILLFGFVLIVLYLVAVIGVFRRKKWAYYTVLVCLIGSTALDFLSGNLIRAIIAGGFLIFFYNAMQPHVPYMD